MNRKRSSSRVIRAYTDGACEGNPGPGGFGVVYYTADEPGSKPVELYGAHSDTTNNQMELMAAIALLEALPDGAQVELHTDSRYVQDGITQWLPGWKARNWRLKSGGAVKNVGLWRRLDKAANRHRVRWLWVKGHAGHDDNERADELARLAIRHWRSGRLPETDLAEDATTPAGAPLNNGAAPSAPSAPSGKPAGRRGLFDEPTQAGQPRPNAARRLVLASTSPYRRQQLARLGLAFEAHAPGVDEAAVKASGLAPVELVRTLARQKAEALAPRVPDGLLIGGDQTVMLDGQALDKPGSAARAVEHLLRLAGRTHHLLTAVAVHDAASGTTREHLDVHEMTMRPLTREQARRYVERDRTWDCAGAYKIEATGIALFRRIYGEDATAIEGLPLLWLCATLAEAGFDPLASG